MNKQQYEVNIIAICHDETPKPGTEECADAISTKIHCILADSETDAIKKVMSYLRDQKDRNGELIFTNYNFIPIKINGRSIAIIDRDCNFGYI